jgi:import inner membrane translocase subunit TIM23
LITFTCGGVGWLVGPILGTAVFNWKIGRNKKQQMGDKEIEFYRRVKRYRVDPAGGSVANPVPGEWIPFSLKDIRV